MENTIYNFKAIDNKGVEVSLSKYKNKVLLIVNTASQCGFTKQYAALQELYDNYQSKGFEILAFPCNQFGGQEPGSDEEISTFCKLNYGVTFPLFKKIEVNGKNAHPLFDFLKNNAPVFLNMKEVKWNFTKFLIDKNGKPVDRFSPTTNPEKIAPKIEKFLNA